LTREQAEADHAKKHSKVHFHFFSSSQIIESRLVKEARAMGRKGGGGGGTRQFRVLIFFGAIMIPDFSSQGNGLIHQSHANSFHTSCHGDLIFFSIFIFHSAINQI
jgi:hypothetical protein